MTDLGALLERAARQAAEQSRPPALAALQRRRARRTTVRASVGAAVLVAATAGVVLLPPGSAGTPDVVVADAAPSAGPSPEAPVPTGWVAVPPVRAGELGLAPGEPLLARLASSYPTEDGTLVTAVRSDGDRVCSIVFTDGGPDAGASGAGCADLTLPVYRSGGIDLGAASKGRSRGGPLDWLVLRGSAPAATRTVHVTAAGGASERLAVTVTGGQAVDRAWFALPWVQEDTVVEALDADGRTLATAELLLGMGLPD